MSVGMWNWLWHLYVHWSALFYRSAIALVFPYIFCYKLTILNWLSLMTLNSKESSLCSGICLGGILSFTWVKLTFPDIFLLVHCFEWDLIGVIELQRVCSPLCHFWMGGSIISFTWVNLNSKEFALSSVSFNLGVNCQFYPGKSENLSLFQVLLLLHRALSFLI